MDEPRVAHLEQSCQQRVLRPLLCLAAVACVTDPADPDLNAPWRAFAASMLAALRVLMAADSGGLIAARGAAMLKPQQDLVAQIENLTRP